MSCSIKLPQRPAFARSTPSHILVSTYQLESSNSRLGSVYILLHSLDIVQCIKAPAGVFRFEFLNEDTIVAAVTDGSLFVATISGASSTEGIAVAEDILLDVSTHSSSSQIFCTDKTGHAHHVDLNTKVVLSSWKAHSLPYAVDGCEVWTCAQNGSTLCTGGEDASLKLWDVGTQCCVQHYNSFDAGVTFCSWQDEHVILTGSYDQHIRMFDTRNRREPVKALKTNGGVWHIEDFQRAGEKYHLASCMYGGWVLFDENFGLTASDESAGEQLLYGITATLETTLAYTTFNDFRVTTVPL